MICSPRASVSLLGKEVPSVSSFAIGAKLALEGRCKDSVVAEPELFLRIQAKGEPVDDFLSATGGGLGNWRERFPSRYERPERSLPSCNTGQGYSSDMQM